MRPESFAGKMEGDAAAIEPDATLRLGSATAAAPFELVSASASVRSHTAIGYRADVDGLRALAVLPVVLFHGGFSYMSGGYVGVDIFFVISGFVIASKLLEELEEGRYSITAFYIRRIRRIIPALVATVVFTYFAALLLFLPDAMEDFSQSVVATAAFVSNLYFWKTSGYFETAALDRPLLHTWSLAIEEQFYLFIPIALYFAFRYFRRYAWIPFLLAAGASLGLSIFITDKAPTANFFLLPTRAWELLLGVLLVLLPLKALANRFANEVLAALGLGLILLAIATYTNETPFPGLAALWPTLGAAILIHVGRSCSTFVGRALSWRPVVAVGLISYSLYLVHWPIIVFARYVLLRDLSGPEIAGVVAASIALATLSYRYVETPLRRAKRKEARATPIFAVAAAALAGIITLGTIGFSTSGFAARFPGYRPQQAVRVDTSLYRRCFLENQDAADWAGDICVRTTGAPANALLWGDSFAAHYMPGLLKNSDALSRNIVEYVFAGCPPILTYASYARPGCQAFNANVFAVIDKYRIDTVVMSARWDELRQRGLSGLKETIAQLKAKNVNVYVVGPSPMFAFDVAVLDYRGAGASANGAAWLLAFDPKSSAALRAESSGANFIDPLAAFCRDRTCRYKSERGLLFSDYGHFSDLGSDFAVRSYFPLYRADARPKPVIAGQ